MAEIITLEHKPKDYFPQESELYFDTWERPCYFSGKDDTLPITLEIRNTGNVAGTPGADRQYSRVLTVNQGSSLPTASATKELIFSLNKL